MLNPDTRSLYTEALIAPPGYVFDQALATTYSLDPGTVLSLPVHLALAERPSNKPVDPIKLLESLRRLSDRLSVYVDQAAMKPPSGSHVLFGFLESMVTSVKAPRGGVFHPKIWVLRFTRPSIEEPPLIRLLILSRNITYDRSWDISLQLEGQPGGKNIGANRELGELLKSLPSMSTQRVSREKKLQAELLADEVRKTVWDLPDGFEEVSFHTLGLKNRSWSLPDSRRMAVVSPFVTKDALEWLNEQTGELAGVISQPDELAQLPQDSRSLAKNWFTLDEAAETEDGEEPVSRDTIGLHAKMYVLEKGWWTTLYMGSANATTAAILQNKNIEIMAELTGKTSQVGGIDKLFDEEGLGSVLSRYGWSEELPQVDEEAVQAQKALEAGRDQLIEADLKIVCRPEGDSWRLTLHSNRTISLEGISQIKAWPITVSEEQAIDVSGLSDSKNAPLRKYATESATGLIAFEIVSDLKRIPSLRLVLNLPVEGLPRNREDAIFKLIINNREGFLRYIYLLLGEYDAGFLAKDSLVDIGTDSKQWSDGFIQSVPILEELARALSRDPDKIGDVRAILERLRKDQDTNSIVPQEFIDLWEVFDEVMKEVSE